MIKKSYYYEYLARDVPDWRMKWARENGHLQHVDLDEKMIRVLACIIRGNLPKGADNDSRLIEHLKAGLAIYTSRVDRLTLEARILAYRDAEVAAFHCGLPRDLVSVYVDAFFDVLFRIDAGGWLNQAVLGDRAQKGDVLRRRLYQCAYSGGPAVAEHWLRHLPHLGQDIAHNLKSNEGLERERLEIDLLASDLDEPLTSRQWAAFNAEIQKAKSEIPHASAMLGAAAVQAINSHLGEELIEKLNKAAPNKQSTSKSKTKRRKPRRRQLTVEPNRKSA